MTEERVMGYIEAKKNGINGEKKDGVKTINNKIYYDATRLSSMYIGGKEQVIKTAWGDESLIIAFPEEQENIEYIITTDGFLVEGGEDKKQITAKFGDEIIFKKRYGTGEYLDIIVKYDGKPIGYLLFVMNQDMDSFEFCNAEFFKVTDAVEGFEQSCGFRIDEELIRSYINAEIRAREE